MVKNTDEAAGRIKRAAADLTNDPKLDREGRRQELAGKAKTASSKAKNKFDNAVDRVKDTMNDR